MILLLGLSIVFFCSNLPVFVNASTQLISSKSYVPSTPSYVSCPTIRNDGERRQMTYYKNKERLWMDASPDHIIWEGEIMSDESCMIQCFGNGRCESFQVFLFSGRRICQLLDIDKQNKSLSVFLYASKGYSVFYYDQFRKI